MFDATFWVSIAFILFFALLIYKGVPKLVLDQIDHKINELKNKINEAENLKNESENLLSKAQGKLQNSKTENNDILTKAQKISDDEIAIALEKMKASLDNKEKSAQNKIEQLKNMMDGLKNQGEIILNQNQIKKLQDNFSASSCNEQETLAIIKNIFIQQHYVIDPHTATAVKPLNNEKYFNEACFCFETAHPAKFPKAITKAIDQYPELPEEFEKIKDKEKFDIIENDINSIKKYILGKI